MPKTGHNLNTLQPQFPAQVSQKLQEGFSITTAEEFLGWAITQNTARHRPEPSIESTPPGKGLADGQAGR